ncbi:MAG: phosphoglycerate mutase, partial [Nanoarchaeota archaeon]
HDNKPVEKKNMIEYIDRTLFDFLRKFAVEKNIKIVITGDHSTPCKLKDHSSDPVPVLLFDNSNSTEKRFTELDSRAGVLGEMLGNELFKKVGFNK